MDNNGVKVKIWGCRGSHPVSGKEYLKYGGNTSCIEVKYQHNSENKRVIFDAGTGLGLLGLSLRDEVPQEHHIFLSHLHPDHIFSLPHFFPLYVGGNRVAIYLHEEYWKSFEKTRGQSITKELVMSYPYYPIHHKEFLASLGLFKFDSIDIDGAKIDGMLVKHFEGAIAHKIEVGGKKIIYAPDMANEQLLSKNSNEFFKGVDLLICDSLYLDEKRDQAKIKKHSFVESVLAFSNFFKIKKVLLFHHSPLNTDEVMGKYEDMLRVFGYDEQNVAFARDGMEITV